MRRFLLILALLIGAPGLLMLGRALLMPSYQVAVEAAAPLAFDETAAIAHLSRALQFRTISTPDKNAFRAQPFKDFHRLLETSYPRVHASLERETINDFSLLYRWPGTDPELPPILLAGHIDVAPVDAGSEADWDHPAFSGEVADGYVYGRGALDMKSVVIAHLEAVEALLAEGFTPARTIYLAYGHDEEIGGDEGAAAIVDTLQERGVRCWFTFDEGLAIVEDMIPGVAGRVALIGLAEKGYLSVELSVKSTGGHSSSPPSQTAVGVLAAAIARLEANKPPARLAGPPRLMFEHLAPEMDWPLRLVMSNLWAFESLVVGQLGAMAQTDAAVRTTTAPTIFAAGTQDNVLPINARAVVNFRIHPSDAIDSIVAHVHEVVDDTRVNIDAEAFEATAPSAVSSADNDAYRQIARTVRQVYSDALVAPSMTLGGTDSKHYAQLAEDAYRIQLMVLREEDLAGIHGTNERVSVDNMLNAVRCYAQLIRNTAG